MRVNPILDTDSYKASHWQAYPSGMTYMQAYLESRGGDYPYTCFFGLQGTLKDRWLGRVYTENDVERAAYKLGKHFGRDDVFNKAGFMHIARELDGRPPMRIRAVPEGTVVPTHNVLMTVESTDEYVPWFSNYTETPLLRASWYGTTVATQSRIAKQAIYRYLEETGDLAGLPFKLHDFGCRGVSSLESACIGGAAHLVNFFGTDTLPAIEYLDELYGGDVDGFSIPATEHSTVTSWGEPHEVEMIRNWLNKFPSGLIANVGDSYDLERHISKYLGQDLRDQIMTRDGTMVVRPDSGNPVTVVLRVLDLLGDAFGFEVNSKGYKVLDPHVRVIQGDGVNPRSIVAILEAMKFHKWSADNLAFGMGGALLQHVDRDGLRFAMKCNDVVVDGVERAVWKRPVTDAGKSSKGGRLKLALMADGQLRTVSSLDGRADFDEIDDQLVTIYENGELLIDQTIVGIRTRAAVSEGAMLVGAGV